MTRSGSTRWDYPSIAVDASGRIIIGAVKFTPGDAGFWTSVSINHGVDWSTPLRVGTSPGAQSRVIATNNTFVAFFPSLTSNRLPTNVYRYESTNGTSWGSPILVAQFTVNPLNQSPDHAYYSSTQCPNPNQ